MRYWQKWLLWAAIVMVLGAVFTTLVLPGIVRSRLISGIEAATGRKAAISRIAINPFTGAVRIDGFRLREQGSEVLFASFSSVRVSLSARSIYRLAPVIGEARIISPYVHLVRTAANSYNFSDLLEGKEKKKKATETAKPPRFSVNNITIENGSVDFIDRALSEEKRHTLRQIEVGIPFISNIPDLADRYVLPHFGAVINGSPLKLDGKLKPFVKGAETSFVVNLKEISLPYYFSYYPGVPPVQIDSGRLSTRLEIAYRVTAQNKPELEVKGDVVLADLKIRDRRGAPLVSLLQGEAKLSRIQVMAGNYSIAALVADGLEMDLSRDNQGGWNFQRLTAGTKPAEKEEKPTLPPSAKLIVSIGTIRLGNGRLHFTDSLPPGGFKTDLSDITCDVSGFSTLPGRNGTYHVTFAGSRGEHGAVKGEFAVEPLAFSASLEMKEFSLDAYYPYLAGVLTAPVKGKLDAGAELSFTADNGLKIANGNVTARQLAVSFGKEEGARLARLVISGVSGDLKGRTAKVEGITLQGGTIDFSRAAGGRLSPLGLLKETKQAAAPGAGKKDGAAPFRYTLKSVSGTGLNIAFTDRLKEDAPLFRVQNLSFSVAGISGPRPAPMPFRIAAKYGANGIIKASGTADPALLKLKGECALTRIDLAAFDPYLPENLNMNLVDGNLDTKLSFAVARTKGKLTGSFSGALGVRSFYALDADGEDLFKWESLELDNLRGSLSPFSLEIAEVALSKFYSRIVIEKNGSLNFKELYTPDQKKGPIAQTGAGQSVPASSPPVSDATAAAGKGTVRIDLVTLQDGSITFIDRHTSPEYSSTMVNLGGRITGLSSEANKLADLDLRGNLENHSPLRITGQINPLRDDLFVDLKVSFTDIELSPLTPYSGTFLGYAVDKGKLNLDLKYRIENKKLESENKVFVDQFSFGQKVESGKAGNLPVRLAVALLKDRKGEIHLDLPVAGRIDDPQFSVWRVVLQMLRNIMAKVATAPFSLLQSTFGGKDDFSGTSFPFGTARLSTAEQAKLLKLAQALHDRPSLKLEVTGFVDRERDPEGYRNELLLKKIKNEKMLALVKEKKNVAGEGSDTLDIPPVEYSTYLKLVYRKDKFPKPRNAVGFVKALPDDEMKKLILTHTAVSSENLQNLARDRVVAVRNYLITEGKLPPERIFEKKGDMFQAPARAGAVASRVEFGVAVQ